MLKEVVIGVIVLVVGWFVISGGDISGLQKLISTGVYQTEKIAQNIEERLPETIDTETNTESVISSEGICPSFTKELLSVTIKTQSVSGSWEGDFRNFKTPYGNISGVFQVTGDSVEEVRGWLMGLVSSSGKIEDSLYVSCRADNRVGSSGTFYQCGRGSNVGQDTSLFYCSGSTSTGKLFFQKTATEYDGTVIKNITTTSILVENFMFDPDTNEVVNVTCKDISAFCK